MLMVQMKIFNGSRKGRNSEREEDGNDADCRQEKSVAVNSLPERIH